MENKELMMTLTTLVAVLIRCAFFLMWRQSSTSAKKVVEPPKLVVPKSIIEHEEIDNGKNKVTIFFWYSDWYSRRLCKAKALLQEEVVLGEIEVVQITKFKKIWSCSQLFGKSNWVSFYNPDETPQGFSSLGHYCQPDSEHKLAMFLWPDISFNQNPKDVVRDSDSKLTALQKPNYTSVWSSDSYNGSGYIWMPNAPVGDREQYTLRISNFFGELCNVYFSEHSGGEWVDACNLEFIEGNKLVVYASRNGHASFPHPSCYLQGSPKLGVGARNDCACSKYYIDTSSKYQIVAAEYLGESVVAEPAWLQFMREWGPTNIYNG